VARAKNTRTANGGGAADDRGGRVAQMRTAYRLTKERDPRLPLIVFGPALLALAALVVIGIVTGHIVLFAILAVPVAILVATSLFGRRATGAMYSQVEGQPGAAASVLQTMRGDWRVTPAVGFNRNMDLVHRVIGRPGVVLVGEGSSPAQLRQLIADQKRRVGRVAPDTPVYDIIVGNDEDQVPLRKLPQRLLKLPRNIGRNDIAGLENRMKALGGTNVPLPKGPMPKSARVPRGKMR
jgi:hypothetical protein